MKVNGIIAEYNPFHNGHKYQLEESLRQTGADYTIVIMSGDFVQRGTPALLEKHRRAEMALKGGADLVLELPVIYASSSAEYFAMGAIATLDKLGVVTNLCFGSECGDISILKKIAQVLVEEPLDYVTSLRQYLKQGYSYPNARNWALFHNYPFLEAYQNLFSAPNNILGIEYIKALLRRNSNMLPSTVLRAGSGYHDTFLGSDYCSALALRQALQSGQNPSHLASHLPAASWEILEDCFQKNSFCHSNDFSQLLYYKLLLNQAKGYERYLDVSSDLSDRISKNLNYFQDYDSFCDLLKTKNMTYTRISRCLLHILLDIDTETLDFAKELDYAPYARVLGFRKEAAELLGAIKKNTSIPLVTKLADAHSLLDEDAAYLLEKDILVSGIYQGILSSKAKRPIQNEYTIPLVIL